IRPGPAAIAPPPEKPPSVDYFFVEPPRVVERRKVSPAWFWAPPPAPALLPAATVASGVRPLTLPDRHMTDRPNVDIAERGRAAELQTNVLLGSTVAVGLAAAALGYFVFRTPAEVAHVQTSRR